MPIDSGEVAVRFFERLLVHSKGEWAGKPFTLQPWQAEGIIRPLFGTLRPDGLRQYQRAYVEVPRKNGKTTLAAGIALALLFNDNEPGAEIYSAAADRYQAGLVFEQAKQFIEASPILSRQARIYRHHIEYPATRGIYRALSADAPTKHGLNAHAVIFDELHAQPDRELWDVMATSMGARRQPLLLAITTAGYDRTSICWEQHEYARQVLEGTIQDPSFFACIYGTDEKADWTDPAIWALANPNYGVSIGKGFMQAECDRARSTPGYQNTFRRLYLNQWTQQDSRWLDMHTWDACKDEALVPTTGQACYGGLDLASSGDLAAFSLVFPHGQSFLARTWFWCPGDALVERTLRTGIPYESWARQGWITPTPGNVIDFDVILRDILQLRTQYNIQEIAFDRWGAVQISGRLTDAGLVMVDFGQNFASMAHPTSELGRLVALGRLVHDGNPVLRWNADNLVVEQDAAGNLKPSKRKSSEKIDGMVSTIMGLDRALRNVGQSVYEERGLLVL